ncbi:MAG: hypothetical protein IPG89_19470 [Bacteroidetes bacterium]|nr:hypothetical protein [Bacteroidota bacterium]
MKLLILILSILTSLQISGQNSTFLKTNDKKNLHYLELGSDNVKVYKMGRFYDKAGVAPSIIQTDTLVFITESEFKGKFYTLLKNKAFYTLIANNGKQFQLEPESELKVNTELNNAYCLKSYIDLSHKLNSEFPLNRFTFRNGYIAWEKQANKSVNHNEFVQQIDKEIVVVFDSISKNQNAFTKTTNFILDNVGQGSYPVLKDSLSKLPIDYKPRSGYFDKAVYQMVNSNPENFYKLLQDFPSSKTFIYFAVDYDKELVKKLKEVQGYDLLKKEFFKDYRYRKSMPYRIFGTYAAAAGFIALLIII